MNVQQPSPRKEWSYVLRTALSSALSFSFFGIGFVITGIFSLFLGRDGNFFLLSRLGFLIISLIGVTILMGFELAVERRGRQRLSASGVALGTAAFFLLMR